MPFVPVMKASFCPGTLIWNVANPPCSLPYFKLLFELV